MSYWYETEGNITDVKTKLNGVIHNIGLIESPYRNDNVFVATGIDDETLSNGNSFIFRDFEAAYQAVIEHFESSSNNGLVL